MKKTKLDFRIEEAMQQIDEKKGGQSDFNDGESFFPYDTWDNPNYEEDPNADSDWEYEANDNSYGTAKWT